MMRSILVWAALAFATGLPIAVAATSPLLAWRSPVYVIAGFAGVAGMGLLLVQPLLIGGYLPTPAGRRTRQLHRWTGIALVTLVALHVGGLWLTSPPDVIDALLFRSPTPFSAWGVIAMWALIVAALLGLFRRRLPFRTGHWHLLHFGVALVVVAGSVIHAVQIEGTMGTVSKLALCALVVIATLRVVFDWRRRVRM